MVKIEIEVDFDSDFEIVLYYLNQKKNLEDFVVVVAYLKMVENEKRMLMKLELKIQ